MKYIIALLLLLWVSLAYAAFKTDKITVTNPTVPTTPTDTCVKGEFSYDGTYWYTCTATNTWNRQPWTAWVVSRTLVNWGGIQVQWQGADVQR